MVTNSGQDEGLIRPVIGAKGMPFFPGSSMKGAFRHACPEEKRHRYCGGEVVDDASNKRTEPGILRFHGGYPIDMDWAQVNRLVDIAHGQQSYQVMKDKKEEGENANVQISLYKPIFRFGISSPEISPDSKEWEEIKQIWESALGYGIGSRVSAGYGYVTGIEPVSDRIIISVHLNGRGIMSQLLLDKTPEFRANMFKATLRGHTLRLLGGLTNETNAKSLTQKIWGGISERGEGGGAIVGKVGINFSIEGKLEESKHTYQIQKQIQGKTKTSNIEMPTYELKNGRLDLVQVGSIELELIKLLSGLIKFSLLLGGFGKSWRRVDHKLFHPSYFNNNNKPAIGCHWVLTNLSQEFFIDPGSDLSGITNLIDSFRQDVLNWIQIQNSNYCSEYVNNWRDAWHPAKVQVWGRISGDGQSQAVQWFHDKSRLKGSSLAGGMGNIGRIWHRMYPTPDGFIELLTIFPDTSSQTQQFLNFLNSTASGFQLLWRSI